jgi:outer membrane protein assembly factor BamA
MLRLTMPNHRQRLFWLFVQMACLPTLPAAAAEAVPPAVANGKETGQTNTQKPGNKELTDTGPSLYSDEDGWLDMSGFIDQAYGFIPLVIPITEPAVGYGAAVGLVFVDRKVENADAGFGRPNMTFVGGMRTENDTKGAFAADSRYWFDDRMQSLAGGFDMSVNLDYYGTGDDPALESDPQRYNISATGLFALGRYRLGGSRSWLGLGYLRADTQLQFKRRPDQPELPGIDIDNELSGLLPEYTYDSRDSIFTPKKGFYFGASMGLFSPELGGDEEFQRLSLFTMGFWPATETLTIGAAAGSIMSSDDTPIYLRPYIQLRGAPAARYQGEYAAQIEAEVRWQFWRRFSAVAFAGAGTAWNEFADREHSQKISTEGFGFRYEMARKYQLHMGLDAAHGPDGMAYYLVFGGAWMRP